MTRVSTRVVVTARRAGTALVPTDSRIGARASDDEDFEGNEANMQRVVDQMTDED